MSQAFVPLTARLLTQDPALVEAVLALNNAHEVELSRLDAGRLGHLVGQAFAAWCVGRGDALLIAFDQDADYDSVNFMWFRARLARFVYVDRVVVAGAARGRGHARLLYEALFAQALAAGHDRVVCEVNSAPPNPASDAFHAGLGFVEMGSGVVGEGPKQVRYLVRGLGD